MLILSYSGKIYILYKYYCLLIFKKWDYYAQKMAKVSKVWTRAKHINENSAKCNLYEFVLTAKGGSTRALHNNLV